MRALDLFSGGGGASEGLHRAGFDTLGIELDERLAFETSAHLADVTKMDPPYLDPVHLAWPDWLHASPPCTTVSTAGRREGIVHRDDLAGAIKRVLAGDPHDLDHVDSTTLLMLEPARWVAALRPTFVSLEQSPNALPVWEAYAGALRSVGYGAWAGYLSAEEFGVAQVRKRAWLIATTLRIETLRPEPSHSRYHARTPSRLDPGVLPWIPMADALGWTDLDASKVADQSGTPVDLRWPWKRPSTVVPATRLLVQHPGATANRFNGSTKSRNDGLVLTVAEAATLQGFAPRGWHPNQAIATKQIGNAVPPPVMEAVARWLTR